VTGGKLIRDLLARGCRRVRQKGSHVQIRCADCATTVPVHAGEDIGPGLLSKIRRDLAPCLGERWWVK